MEQPNSEGAIPFLDTLPKPNGNEISVSVYRKPTHMDKYLDFKSCHPISAKGPVVRALMDRAENVCSDPVILAKEMEHLNKVLYYNNYPQWMIDKCGRSEQSGPLIHPERGNEIKKQFFVLVPYFPGLSESFKYTHIQVCFKEVNTLKSLLMHPKDKVSTKQMKDIVYHWQWQADGCNSSGRGSRNTLSLTYQQSSNTVWTTTTHYPPLTISPVLTRIPLRLLERQKKQYILEGWIQV